MSNIVLFDMDGTLTPARKKISKRMVNAIIDLLMYTEVGIVTGSGLDYLKEPPCLRTREGTDEGVRGARNNNKTRQDKKSTDKAAKNAAGHGRAGQRTWPGNELGARFIRGTQQE